MALGTDQESTKDLIFRSLTISNDLFRNSRDVGLATSGHELIYCLDATAFSIFYDAHEWRHSIVSFDGNLVGRSKPTRDLAEIQAQCALIASEQMISKLLPGAVSNAIYLTQWHRKELAKSLEAVVSDYKSGLKSANMREQIEDELREKMRVVWDYHKQGDAGFSDSAIAEDISDLQKFVSNPDALRRYQFTRRAAATLVNCPQTERLDQAYRLLSEPLRSRIRGLHSLFKPRADELPSIKRDAEHWFYRLHSEMVRSMHWGRKSKRGINSLWRDAQSLAFVRWVSNTRLRPDQLIVFVTNDDLLFDAYRRWWVEQSSIAAHGEESFILRRAFQFSPMFNISDFSNDIVSSGAIRSDVQSLFRRIREAVELSLLPFNLSTIRHADRAAGELSTMRGREHLAMLAKDSRGGEKDGIISFFLAGLGEKWFSEQGQMLKSIAEVWQRIERLSVGFFYDSVIARLAEDRYVLGLPKAHVQDEQFGKGALAFFSSALDVLEDRSRAVWLPQVIHFLREQGKDTLLNTPRRAPLTSWYKLPSGRLLSEVPMKVIQSEGLLEEVEESPEALFVLASMFAIQSMEWWKAEEFMFYALCACEERQGTRETRLELQFQYALTKRFRLAGVNSDMRSSYPIRAEAALTIKRRALSLFEEARALLDDCVSYYTNNGDMKLYLLRSLSERAALLLVFALQSFLLD